MSAIAAPAENEKNILAFWEKEKIYEKAKRKNAKGKKFYFMDGPPYATGHIHMGTALNKILKDIALRSRRMQGYDVLDRPGYDTHGVPIELQVEKEIGIKNKSDIERYGVARFVAQCRAYATKYIDVMNNEFKNLGVWMDWEHPYLTLEDSYIESIWSAFKEADKKGLLYLGKYPVHVCPRCESAVAFNEIEYGKQRDLSIFVKFPLKKRKNAFLIIWTTTPWTLPANTAVMAHPNVVYQEVETNKGEHWIIAKDLVRNFFDSIGRKYTVKDEFVGKKMKEWEYENPLSRYLKLNVKNGYRVVLSHRYVTTENGTGLVHCAPGHGKEDYEVGKEYGLDMPSLVASNGVLTGEAGKYAGRLAREVDKQITDDLRNDGFLAHQMMYDHDYPLCWRDKTPLLMIAQPQWFLRISKIQKKLLAENEKVHWIPGYMKLRMKAWLEGVGDWPVSRQRYWGTPLPIWYDHASGEKIVVGSIDELKKLSGRKSIGMHKPEIDNITISTKTGRVLHRVPEVLDVWFDSGVSSWASLGYPKDTKKFKRYWPADLNIEGTDQFRGWWNSQIILSEILFDQRPFESILVHGLMLGLGKRKMSKSLGNTVMPSQVIERYGRDYLRYYFAKLSRGDDFLFDEAEFKEIQKVMTIFLNVHAFISGLEKKRTRILTLEDRWILSRYFSFVQEATTSYNSYRFPEVVQLFERFLVHDLSRTYIQMIRERSDVRGVLEDIFVGLVRILAPICPFLCESLWPELGQDKQSVHLSELPSVDRKKIAPKLEESFHILLKILEMGMAKRDEAKVGLRWPLSLARVTSNVTLDKEFYAIIRRQLNVKNADFKRGTEISVELDHTPTPELISEGYSREIARYIQSERKKAGLQKGDLIDVQLFIDDGLRSMLNSHLPSLHERTNARTIVFVDIHRAKNINFFTVRDKKIGVKLS